MKEEYEVVFHSDIECFNLFLVQLSHRNVHIHKDFELAMVVSGSDLNVKVEQKAVFLSPNDMYLINPMEAHEFTSSGSGTQILVIQFSPRLFETVLQDAQNLRFGNTIQIRDYFEEDCRKYHMLRAIFVELAYRYLKHEAGYEYQCVSLVNLLFSILQSALPWKMESEKKIQALKFRVDRMFQVTDYIDQNFQRKLLLSELAEKEQLNLTYLSHLFKDTLGTTFQNYVNKQRFEYACRLVEKTDHSILDISIESGFSDVRYLNRMFSECFGCTPREYRQNLRSHKVQASVLSNTTQLFYSQKESLLLVEQLRDALMKSVQNLTFWEVFGWTRP